MLRYIRVGGKNRVFYKQPFTHGQVGLDRLGSGSNKRGRSWQVYIVARVPVLTGTVWVIADAEFHG